MHQIHITLNPSEALVARKAMRDMQDNYRPGGLIHGKAKLAEDKLYGNGLDSMDFKLMREAMNYELHRLRMAGKEDSFRAESLRGTLEKIKWF
jgi:hypothetical protein